jgi:ribosome-associated protein
MVWITDSLEIPDDELSFAASRSSGAGGQNVNKVNTRVTLAFDLSASPSLTPDEKGRIGERLATRVNKNGVLRVTSQRHRTQAANRDAAVARFVELVRAALYEEPPRRPTRVPRSVREHRLSDKRRQAARKQERARPDGDDE